MSTTTTNTVKRTDVYTRVTDRIVQELGDGAAEGFQGVAVVQPQGLDDGEDALHEAAPVGALAAERLAAPQHGAALHALGVVVGRVDALGRHEHPQQRVALQQGLAMADQSGVAGPLADASSLVGGDGKV